MFAWLFGPPSVRRGLDTRISPMSISVDNIDAALAVLRDSGYKLRFEASADGGMEDQQFGEGHEPMSFRELNKAAVGGFRQQLRVKAEYPNRANDGMTIQIFDDRATTVLAVGNARAHERHVVAEMCRLPSRLPPARRLWMTGRFVLAGITLALLVWLWADARRSQLPLLLLVTAASIYAFVSLDRVVAAGVPKNHRWDRLRLLPASVDEIIERRIAARQKVIIGSTSGAVGAVAGAAIASLIAWLVTR